jgi:hypothetical protein
MKESRELPALNPLRDFCKRADDNWSAGFQPAFFRENRIQRRQDAGAPVAFAEVSLTVASLGASWTAVASAARHRFHTPGTVHVLDVVQPKSRNWNSRKKAQEAQNKRVLRQSNCGFSIQSSCRHRHATRRG